MKQLLILILLVIPAICLGQEIGNVSVDEKVFKLDVSIRDYTAYEVYKRDPNTYDDVTKELTVAYNEATSEKDTWRLIYYDGKVLNLFESKGITWTINNIFMGTLEDCEKEIDSLKLKIPDDLEVLHITQVEPLALIMLVG